MLPHSYVDRHLLVNSASSDIGYRLVFDLDPVEQNNGFERFLSLIVYAQHGGAHQVNDEVDRKGASFAATLNLPRLSSSTD